jgi:SH3-like domain-containing protein
MLEVNRGFAYFASIFFTSFIMLCFMLTSKANEEGAFLCTKSDNVNGRNGPNTNFAIMYKISQVNYPVKVIKKIENWFAVEDFKGDKMWISASNLKSKCGKIIKINHTAEVKIKPDIKSNTILNLGEGFIVNNAKCYQVWCYIKIDNKKGWILKEKIWNYT